MPNVLTERAIFARVSRRLNHDGVFLHRSRVDSRMHQDYGRYYATDDRNCICNPSLDNEGCLLEYAKELGVVSPETELAS